MIPLSITVATRMLSKNAHNENLNNCGAVKKNSVFKIVLNKTGKNQRNPPVLADFFNFIKERKAQLWFLPDNVQ